MKAYLWVRKLFSFFKTTFLYLHVGVTDADSMSMLRIKGFTELLAFPLEWKSDEKNFRQTATLTTVLSSSLKKSWKALHSDYYWKADGCRLVSTPIWSPHKSVYSLLRNQYVKLLNFFFKIGKLFSYNCRSLIEICLGFGQRFLRCGD